MTLSSAFTSASAALSPRALWVHGVSGRMGRALREEMSGTSTSGAPWVLLGGSHHGMAPGEELFTQAAGVLDFTGEEGSQALLQFFQKSAPPPPAPLPALLIGSTGLTSSTLEAWQSWGARTQVLVTPNTSLGILLFSSALRTMGGILSAVEDPHLGFLLEETHRQGKKDAPSGTALLLEKSFSHPLSQPIHSWRVSQVAGEHSFRVVGLHEELVITHRAFSPKVFAAGALTLMGWLLQQPAGFYSWEELPK